ncbi:hypothetical protein TNCV_805591 [Trichonephila clavipes]|nr:hypothetical protein TNCV_805591 [Trichonephila clavipes]
MRTCAILLDEVKTDQARVERDEIMDINPDSKSELEKRDEHETNLEMGSDGTLELLDSNNQELTIDELIEMHEQDIEELESLDPVKPKIE